MIEPKIYLDLPPELRQVLNDSGLTVADVLRREGVELSLNIREAELPAAVAGEKEKDIGLVLTDPTFLLSLSTAVSTVILALSRFLKDREHAPRLVETYVEKEITGADGKHRKVLVLEKQFIQPHTALNTAELETKLGLKDGMVVKFRTEDRPNQS